jgi:hypothetical protein
MGKPSAELFSTMGDQFLGREYKNNNFDCQDFVEQCMHKVGITTNLPGSNAWYRKMTWVGTPAECKKKFGSIPKGALLFILYGSGGEPEKYKADGIGNASHIGIYTGRSGREMVANAKAQGNFDADKWNCGDGAIHSSSSRGHVVTSKFAGKEISGGWNRIGLWDVFDYGSTINKLLGNNGDDKQEGVTIVIGYATVTGGTLNLREEMDTGSFRLAQIPDGETVAVIEQPNSTWSKVTYGTKTGYVMSKYLTTTANNEKTGVKITIPKECAVELYEALKFSLGK